MYFSRYILLSFLLVVVLSTVAVAHAQVMQSSSYRIEADSINAGGLYSSSTTYRLEDTTGEVGTGRSESASYILDAGYQQMLVDYLALTAAADVTLSPSLGGITGGTSNGSTDVTVTTDSAAGYELQITASSSPAMQSSVGTIADYTPAGASPDFTFSVAAGTAEFAFSPEGADIAQRYKDDGASCNTGSGDTTLSCWDALSTSATTIAERSSGNHPDGTLTTIRFRVGVGVNAGVVEGFYTATTTVTAFAL